MLLLGCVGDGEHYAPRQFESFRDPLCWGQVGVCGAALAGSVERALCDRLRLAGVHERGDLAHCLEKHERFTHHVMRFAAAVPNPAQA